MSEEGIKRLMETIRQLRQREGEYYERWLAGIITGARKTKKNRKGGEKGG